MPKFRQPKERMRTDQKEAAVDNTRTHTCRERDRAKKGSDEKSDGFKINN